MTFLFISILGAMVRCRAVGILAQSEDHSQHRVTSRYFGLFTAVSASVDQKRIDRST
jgi:hypothetical protein